MTERRGFGWEDAADGRRQAWDVVDGRTIEGMWLRRAFFGWLIPAAFVLPLWMFVGWIAFDAGGWALLWVLLLAMPGLFVWQLVLSLLVRARGTVRAGRAVSWWDVLGFTVWHALVISLGFFDPAWWAPALVVAIVAGLALFWLELWQLWREARPSAVLLRTSDGLGYIPPSESPRAEPDAHDVFIVTERPGSTSS
ncbi:MFS transporter permease [Microbacterium koreense]|uniref:MFS transporter permease n=1 Tax=Microbacterium koreense TaxID=323761 RepID=A0ABW2ZRZ4_9MICO